MASTTATVSTLADFLSPLGRPHIDPNTIRIAARESTITQPLIKDSLSTILNKDDIPNHGAALLFIGALADASDTRLIGMFDNVVSTLSRTLVPDTAADVRLLPLTMRTLFEVLSNGPSESGKAKGQAVNKVIDMWEDINKGGYSKVLVSAVTVEVLTGLSLLLRRGTYKPNKPTVGRIVALLVPFILDTDSALMRMEACGLLVALPSSKIGDIGPDTHTGVLADVLTEELNVKNKASPSHLIKVCQLIRSLLRSGKCQEIPFKNVMKFQHICTRSLLLHARQRTFDASLGQSLATQTIGLLYDTCTAFGPGLVSILSTILVKRNIQPIIEGMPDMPDKVASALSSAMEQLLNTYPSLGLVDHSLHSSVLALGPSDLLATLCRISQPSSDIQGDFAGSAMRILLESSSTKEDLNTACALLHACAGLLSNSGMGPAAAGLLYRRGLPVPKGLQASVQGSGALKTGTSVCDEFTAYLMSSLKRRREEESIEEEGGIKKARSEGVNKPSADNENPFAITIGGKPIVEQEGDDKERVVVSAVTEEVIEIASESSHENKGDQEEVATPRTPAIAVIRDDDNSDKLETPASSSSPISDILQTPESDSDTMSDVPDLCMDPPDEEEEEQE